MSHAMNVAREWDEWRHQLLYGTTEPTPRMHVRNPRLQSYFDGHTTARLNHQGDIVTSAPADSNDMFDRLEPEQAARAIALSIASQTIGSGYARGATDVVDAAEFIVSGDIVLRSKRKDHLIVGRHSREADGTAVWRACDVERDLTAEAKA
jgi:hypothetical protein